MPDLLRKKEIPLVMQTHQTLGICTTKDDTNRNVRWDKSEGHPSDKTDPESIYKIHHDGDVRRRSHAEYCNARGGKSDYTKP